MVNINLRSLTLFDVTERYINCLNDPEINKYLSIRDTLQTLATVKAYVLINDVLGIFVNDLHIGNLTRSINDKNKYITVGIAIFDKNYHGKGYASQALKLFVDDAFLNGFNRVEAGVNVSNIKSRSLFDNAGFYIEGVKKEADLIDGVFNDVIIYAKLKSDVAVFDGFTGTGGSL